MKRKTSRILFVLLALSTALLPAQEYISVPVDDIVYTVINDGRIRGICDPKSEAKPYSRKTVIALLNQMIDAGLSSTEETAVRNMIARFSEKEAGLDLSKLTYTLKSAPGTFKSNMTVGGSLTTEAFGGWYNDYHNWGGNFIPELYVNGDFSNYLSYNFDVFGIAARAPLVENGTYTTTSGWGHETTDNKTIALSTTSYSNLICFPFSYSKKWDGSVYKASNLTASGLTGWPDGGAFSFGINSEISSSLFDNRLSIRFGRIYREWAAMDDGSSLVLNSAARPFLAGEFTAELFPWLHFSGMTGILEFDKSSEDVVVQNAYSIDMLELDFKYFHTDFGTSCVWPKRLEFGYAFPLINKVFYQNDIGDYDNLNLFGNLKLQYPGIGNIWFSLFLDEFNLGNLKKGWNVFTYDREMYATQAGMKVNVPFLPFSTASFRYTKVEPYCYTHQQLNNTPWYEGTYISEAYMNNGESIGYYLPPNSDEFHLHLETRPSAKWGTYLQYQFIRHGADYGSEQVDGSSLYSELNPHNRDTYRKYFLYDGAYQWFSVVQIGGDMNMNIGKMPVKFYGSAGYVWSWFTVIDQTTYDDNEKASSFAVAANDEYPSRSGIVGSLGFILYPQ
jgi:hypothetical protein